MKLSEAKQILKDNPSNTYELIVNNGAVCVMLKAEALLSWLREPTQRTIFDEDEVELNLRKESDPLIEFLDNNPPQEESKPKKESFTAEEKEAMWNEQDMQLMVNGWEPHDSM